MTWKRSAAVACLAAGIGVGVAIAQEPTPTPPPAPAPSADTPVPPDIEAKPKESFFGNRFALYLEVRGGVTSADGIRAPIESSQNLESVSELRLQDLRNGEFTIGWTLPRDRGQYLFTYTGISDGGYELDATGLERAYLDPSGGPPKTLESPVPWWNVSVRDGSLHSVQKPAIWDSSIDDADGDTFPDGSEIQYPTTAIDISRSVPDDLGTQLSTYDLYYRREFGGTRIHARWTAGARYLDFGGTIPTPIWITRASTVPGTGFSDGVLNPFLLLEQNASGWGPVGSAEVQFNFFRRRLQLYGLVRASFMVMSTEVDSGIFEYLARDTATGNLVPNQGSFTTKIDKSSWNSAFEAGVRFRIVDGLHVFADWNTSGYLDPIIIPTAISLPSNSQQIDQPIGVSYKTEDIVLSTVELGLSFQF